MIAVFLQVRLPLLEQVFLDFSHRPIVIVSESVGPFEDFKRVDDTLLSIFHEGKFGSGVVHDLVQLLDGHLNFACESTRSRFFRTLNLISNCFAQDFLFYAT